jgi:hypothetical protein
MLIPNHNVPLWKYINFENEFIEFFIQNFELRPTLISPARVVPDRKNTL